MSTLKTYYFWGSLQHGHNIESDVIERRYIKGIKNLFDIYLPIADNVLILDNSFSKSSLIAKKGINDELEIIDDYKFNQIKFFYD